MSDGFILEGEPHIGNFSESESEFESDFEDDWESCVSSVEEDEYFYDVDSLANSQDASYYSFPTRSLFSNFNFETNLSGLAMDCEHPLKSDQVPDLNEKANLTQKSQVPELYETYLVEGRKLPSMMEKETHVDSEQTDIGQVLIDIVEDQSEVHKRAEIANSGLSQSNQCRLGKSDGEPGNPLPVTKSDRQSQKAGLGNLSLNSPNIVVGNLFQHLDYYLECIPMDEFGIWSSFLDILDLVRAEFDSLDIYANDQKKHENSRRRYSDIAYSNVPNDEN